MGQSLTRKTELQAQVSPAFGVTAIFPILITANLDTLDIALSGGMDITAFAGVTQVGEGIPEIITSVDLVGNGSTPICSVPFTELVNGNIWRRTDGLASIVSQPAIGADAVAAFSATGTIDLKSYLALRPKDTALLESQFNTLQLKLNIAPDFSGAFSGGTISVAGSTIAINVVAHETIELPNAQNVVTMPTKRILYASRDVNFAGAANKQQFLLNPGQTLRGITLRSETAAKALSDAILSAVRVYVGNSLRYNVSAAGIVAANAAMIKAARTTGRYFLNFTEESGSLERLNNELDLSLATLAGANAYIELDIAGAGIVKVTQWGHQAV